MGDVKALGWHDYLRKFFFVVIVRPLMILLLGLNVRHYERLKIGKNRIIAANHNSHLDALVLMSLIKARDIPNVKLVAAKDYFCRGKFTTWLAMNIIGIIPIERDGGSRDPLAPINKVLDEGYTVVIFPEGTRGDPEKRQPFKYGVAKLLEERPEAIVTPVFMFGLGKSLPKGEMLLVPFVCDIVIGNDLGWTGDRASFVQALESSFDEMDDAIGEREWS